MVAQLAYGHNSLSFKLLTSMGGFRTVEADINDLEIVDASHIDKQRIFVLF